jgi:hypothetical protein
VHRHSAFSRMDKESMRKVRDGPAGVPQSETRTPAVIS